MSQPTVPITCACCNTPGLHQGRGLIGSCYERHRQHRTLDRFPLTRPVTTWTPTTPKGRRALARYAELVAEKTSPARIQWELSLSQRQLQRYAAALNNSQHRSAA